MQFKQDLLLYWVRDGLKPIDFIAPNWAPRWSYLLLPVYTQQHTAGFTENNELSPAYPKAVPADNDIKPFVISV